MCILKKEFKVNPTLFKAWPINVLLCIQIFYCVCFAEVKFTICIVDFVLVMTMDAHCVANHVKI